MTFSWLDRMMIQGYKKSLTEIDLWALRREDQADALGNKLQRHWDAQRVLARQGSKKKPSIWIALTKSYGMPFLIAAFFKLFQDILGFAQPQLLRLLLIWVDSYRTDEPAPAANGYMIAILMFFCAVAQSFALHQYFARCFETSMRVRGGLIHVIYKKSLVLSNDERSGRATGDIVNLQSTDATRMADICQYGQIAWSGSFQIVLAFISLYNLLGWYGLVGVGVMVLGIPMNSYVARLQSRLQKRQMKNKDQRSRIMNEILNNIRTIKLACWESAFAKKLSAVRNDKELTLLRRMGYLSSVSTFLWSFMPFLVAFATFATFAIFSGRPLTSQIVFPALSLFNLIGFPMAVLPNVITAWVEGSS
jgi:ATP-binding cassette subfamily C (CFTR/MRP) protein 1